MSGEEDAPVLVLDTNVLISGLLNPHGVPATILRMAVAGEVKLAYDARILAEYRDVVRRPRFKLDLRLTEEILDALVAEGMRVTSTSPRVSLPDPDDEPFLEVAAAAGTSAVLVTGNVQHFPADARQGIEVMTPRQWLEHWRRQTQHGGSGRA